MLMGNEKINWQDKQEFEKRIKAAQTKIKESVELADKARYAIELDQIKLEVQQMNDDLSKTDQLQDKIKKWNNGLFGNRSSRIDNRLEDSKQYQRNINDRLSKLEGDLGINKTSEVSPESQVLADKYTFDQRSWTVTEIATWKKMTMQEAIAKENSLAGAQQVIPGGGVLGNLNTWLQNQVGYKKSNADNMTQMAKYAAVAGLIYLRWTKTKWFAETVGYAALAYGLLSPCGGDLRNIIMNGKSNALNGKWIMAMGIWWLTGATPESIATQKKSMDTYNVEKGKLYNDNYSIAMPLYSIFKDQKDILTYINPDTGDFDFAKFLADYNNTDGVLKSKLNVNIPGAADTKWATTELYMQFLTGKLMKDNKMLELEDLKKAQTALNLNRSEYLKSIWIDPKETDKAKIAAALAKKQAEIKELEKNTYSIILKNTWYIVTVGKEAEAIKLINDMSDLSPKDILAKLKEKWYIQVDEKVLSNEAMLLKGKTEKENIPYIDQVQYEWQTGENAVALMALDLRNEVRERWNKLEKFDIYNEDGKLYIQNDNRRIELVLQNGAVARLWDFNNDVSGDLMRMMKIWLGMSYNAKFLWLLDQTTTKDKDGKEVVVEKHKFTTNAITKNIEIEDKRFNTWITGSMWKGPMADATWLLDLANTTEQDNNYLAKSLNTLADQRKLWRAVQDKYVAASINRTYDDKTKEQNGIVINTANNSGNNMNLEQEETLRQQIRNTFIKWWWLIKDLTEDTIGWIYDMVKGGTDVLSQDMKKLLWDPDKTWYQNIKDWWNKIIGLVDKWRERSRKFIGENFRAAIDWFIGTIGKGLWLSYDQVMAFVQNNKMVAWLLWAAFGLWWVTAVWILTWAAISLPLLSAWVGGWTLIALLLSEFTKWPKPAIQ